MTDRQARLKEVMKEFNKKNPGVMKFGSDEKPREQLSWGIVRLDELTGGLRRGNWSVAYGSKSVGKTTLVLQAIAHNQKLGMVCCYIDMERTFDVARAIALGVNMDELILITGADTAEEVMNIIIRASREKVIDLFVVDSVQAMSPQGEQFSKIKKDGSGGSEKDMTDDTIALLPRKLSQFFRVCAGPLYKSNAVGILIGQTRTGGIGTFIVRDEMTGGQAIKFYNVSTIAMRTGQGADAPTKKVEVEVDEVVETEDDMVTTKKMKKKDVKIGHDCVFKLEKTKITGSKPEGSELHLPFYFETGFIAPVEQIEMSAVSTDTPAPEVVQEKKKKSKRK